MASRIDQYGNPYGKNPHMARTTVKTTIEVSDDLAREAKRHAAAENITLRELFERGLRMAMRADRENGRFVLRDASVGGRGLRPEFQDADWARLRETVYEGRGG